MAAEAQRAPSVREQKTAPAIEQAKPTINDVPGALDDASCFIERLRALLKSNTDNMSDCLVQADTLPRVLQGQALSIWMIFVLAAEKLAEIDDIINAINAQARVDRRAVAA